MNILGCLDQPTTGSYKVKGRETRQLEADELAQLRREYFGFIFQRYHLLGDLSAAGNVEVPAIYAGADVEERQARATALLSDLGLADKTQNRPSQLSGGQQQRVSIARALMNGGDVILADEPTGALDKNSGIEVMRILRELNAKVTPSSWSHMTIMSLKMPHGLLKSVMVLLFLISPTHLPIKMILPTNLATSATKKNFSLAFCI